MTSTFPPVDTRKPITLDGVTWGRWRVETESSNYTIDFDRMRFTRTPRTDTADDQISTATLFELADGDTRFESAFVVLYQRMVIQLADLPKCLTSTAVLLIEQEA